MEGRVVIGMFLGCLAVIVAGAAAALGLRAGERRACDFANATHEGDE